MLSIMLKKDASTELSLVLITCTLISERLREGINLLNQIYPNRNFVLWGVINGLKKDYIIVADYNFRDSKYFPSMNYFWR